MLQAFLCMKQTGDCVLELFPCQTVNSLSGSAPRFNSALPPSTACECSLLFAALEVCRQARSRMESQQSQDSSRQFLSFQSLLEQPQSHSIVSGLCVSARHGLLQWGVGKPGREAGMISLGKPTGAPSGARNVSQHLSEWFKAMRLTIQWVHIACQLPWVAHTVYKPGGGQPQTRSSWAQLLGLLPLC